VFKASQYDIIKAIEGKDSKEQPLEEIVPKQYHELLPLISKALADMVPPHPPGIDYEVLLRDGEIPTWGPLYWMSSAKFVALKDQLENTISKVFIRQSSSACTESDLFEKKPDGGIRFCIDYRDINSMTIKNKYPLRLIKKTLNLLGKGKRYTKLDIRGPHKIHRVEEGDEHMLAFLTRYGLVEPKVMYF